MKVNTFSKDEVKCVWFRYFSNCVISFGNPVVRAKVYQQFFQPLPANNFVNTVRLIYFLGWQLWSVNFRGNPTDTWTHPIKIFSCQDKGKAWELIDCSSKWLGFFLLRLHSLLEYTQPFLSFKHVFIHMCWNIFPLSETSPGDTNKQMIVYDLVAQSSSKK